MADENDSNEAGEVAEPLEGGETPDVVDVVGAPDVAEASGEGEVDEPDPPVDVVADAVVADVASTAAVAAVGTAVAQLGERMAAVEAAVFAIGSVGEVLDAVVALEQRVSEIGRLADRHNELIDKLHAENQSLRKGELTQAVAPIFRDLIRLSDQLAQLDETSTEPGKGDAALAGRQVLEILARSGVRPEDGETGVPFDSAAHQGIGRRPTDDPAVDGMVASVRRPGFVGPDGKLLRAAEVEVWRYEAPATAAATDVAPADVAADVPPAPVAVPAPAAATEEPPTEPADLTGDTEGDD